MFVPNSKRESPISGMIDHHCCSFLIDAEFATEPSGSSRMVCGTRINAAQLLTPSWLYCDIALSISPDFVAERKTSRTQELSVTFETSANYERFICFQLDHSWDCSLWYTCACPELQDISEGNFVFP
ncbi:hypothetical protein FGB62_55g039 [Gracilaria domingensis]|nr:hypothetical protein FGB62_55g039 [Gracilaria domingensis]